MPRGAAEIGSGEHRADAEREHAARAVEHGLRPPRRPRPRGRRGRGPAAASRRAPPARRAPRAPCRAAPRSTPAASASKQQHGVRGQPAQVAQLPVGQRRPHRGHGVRRRRPARARSRRCSPRPRSPRSARAIGVLGQVQAVEHVALVPERPVSGELRYFGPSSLGRQPAGAEGHDAAADVSQREHQPAAEEVDQAALAAARAARQARRGRAPPRRSRASGAAVTTRSHSGGRVAEPEALGHLVADAARGQVGARALGRRRLAQHARVVGRAPARAARAGAPRGARRSSSAGEERSRSTSTP